MASPNSVLAGARAFARDFARDRMPAGYLWDVADYVPLIIDAPLTGRGGWQWASTVMGGDADAGILGIFNGVEKLLVVGHNRQWYEVSQTPPYTATPVGAAGAADLVAQNPVQNASAIISFDSSGANVPQVVTYPGGVFNVARMDASAPKAPVGVSRGNYIIAGGAQPNTNFAWWSYPGDPMHAWDANSNTKTKDVISALGALRGVILVFHPGSVERIRGVTPDHTGGTGDLFLESLFDRVGCVFPKSIAYWNENCIFADSHGVHLTDGAVIRNLATQGSILTYWRTVYGNAVSVAGTTFLDYYLVTVRRSDGTAITLICDLNARQWFRFTNVYALSMFGSSGTTSTERIWGGMAGTNRLARISPCFFPSLLATPIADDDGTPVLPSFETAWMRAGREGRKRTRFGYLSYDVRDSGARSDAAPSGWRNGVEIDPELTQQPPPEVLNVAAMLEVGFITSPSNLNYTIMGSLPSSADYTRYRLPIWRAPYGIAFRVRQMQPSVVTRIYDLALEGQPMEESRV
jgi:hypothetical protein